MGLQKHPVGKTSRLGVKWTQWLFPSMVISAIYRKFFKRPEDPYAVQRISRLNVLSASYLVVASAIFTFSAYAYFYAKDEDGMSAAIKRDASLTRAFYPARVISKDRLDEGVRVRHIKISGFRVVEDCDITEETKQLIEEKRK